LLVFGVEEDVAFEGGLQRMLAMII
jgi:hypothetical protein